MEGATDASLGDERGREIRVSLTPEHIRLLRFGMIFLGDIVAPSPLGPHNIVETRKAANTYSIGEISDMTTELSRLLGALAGASETIETIKSE